MQTHQLMERLLKLEGCYNTRDIGGYRTRDGKKTRLKTVLRSDNPHSLTEASQGQLLNYGVKTIIDLRYQAEVDKEPNILANSSKVIYLNLPLFDEEVAVELGKVGTLLNQYLLMLDYCQQQIRVVMTIIACTDAVPVLLHCSDGKDRTGLITALLLSAANVSPATIALDYAQSAKNLAPIYERSLEVIKARRGGYAHLFESPVETMLETMEYLQQQYGGIIGYLRTIGMTDEQINSLREKLVES